MSKTIDTFRGEYAFLSNFYEVPVRYGNLIYDSAEAAFQAAKCLNLADRLPFARMKPGEAKRAGRRCQLRPDWESVKVDVMRDVLAAKFENPVLRRKLLDTEDAVLIEGNNWNDTFWGVCRGKGENMLGRLLEELRENLRH